MPPDKRSTPRRRSRATAAGGKEADAAEPGADEADPEEQGTAGTGPLEVAGAQAGAGSGEPPGAATRSPTVLSHQELQRLRARLIRKYH
jgi:hypothetical protein